MVAKKSTDRSRRRVLLVMYWWEDRVLEGVVRYASEHNWELDCRMRWTRSTEGLDEWRGDGIIANTGVTHPLRRFIGVMRRAAIPVVSTQQLRERRRARVIVPHRDVGKAAAEHLVSLGFADLGFVWFEKNEIERNRRQGFAEVVAAAGGDHHDIRFQDLPRAFRSVPRPLGLMAANDLNALGVMRACLDAGYRVPEEFAIVGVDDTELLCRFAPVPLSSVNCNFEAQGYAAAAMLDDIMSGKEAPAAPQTIQPVGVTVRRSTDTVPIPDLAAARVLNYIRTHYHEPVRIADIVRTETVSLRRLQEIFRSYVGRTMHEELTRLRVERAGQLLLTDPRVKLEAVAAECGFANRFHLSRAFTRTTGLSPNAYRKRKQVASSRDRRNRNP